MQRADSLTRNVSPNGDEVPLQARQSSAASSPEQNRQLVRETQRQLANELLWYSVPSVLCIVVIVVVLAAVGIWIYIRGWFIWGSYRDKPCDQPLKWWLVSMLMAPLFQWQLDTLLAQCPKTKEMVKSLVMPAVIVVGIWMVAHCRTCESTNPHLYRYAKMYLIYQSVIWVVMMFTYFGLVSTVFWLRRHGLLQDGPGPARAARPGLIEELETVEYSENLFEAEPDGSPAECAICSEPFSHDTPIKRTPCGHSFHKACLGNWLGNYGRSCPLCRQDLEELCEQSPSA